MGPERAQSVGGVSAHAECVLLHPSGEEPSAELRAALVRHGVRLTRARSTYDALSELCRLGRSTGGQATSPVILLLAHPERLHEPALLYKAAQRYAPQASCWIFDPEGSPRLRAVVPEDVEHWSPSGIERLVARPTPSGSMRAAAHGVGNGARFAGSVDGSVRRHGAEPVLRLTHTVSESKPMAAVPSAPVASESRPAEKFQTKTEQVNETSGEPPVRVTRQALTDEELAMLLDDGPSL
jgi:hypothetical protein